MDLSGVEAILYAVLAFSLGLYPVGILLPCSDCCDAGIESDTFCRCLRYERQNASAPECGDYERGLGRGYSRHSYNLRSAGFLKRCRRRKILSREKKSDLREGAVKLFRSQNGEILEPRVRTNGESLSAGEEAVRYIRVYPIFSRSEKNATVVGSEYPLIKQCAWGVHGPESPSLETDEAEDYEYELKVVVTGVALPLLPLLPFNPDQESSLTLSTATSRQLTRGMKTVFTSSTQETGINARTPVSAQVIGAGLEIIDPGYDQYFDGSVVTEQSLLGLVTATNETSQSGSNTLYTVRLDFEAAPWLYQYLPLSGTNFPVAVVYLVEQTHGPIKEYWTWKIFLRNPPTTDTLPPGGLTPLNAPPPQKPAQPAQPQDSFSTTLSGKDALIAYTMGGNQIPEDQQYINAPEYEYVSSGEQLIRELFICVANGRPPPYAESLVADVFYMRTNNQTVSGVGPGVDAREIWSPACLEETYIWAAGCANKPLLLRTPYFGLPNISTDPNVVLSAIQGSGSIPFSAFDDNVYQPDDIEFVGTFRVSPPSPLCGNVFGAPAPQELINTMFGGRLIATIESQEGDDGLSCPTPEIKIPMIPDNFGGGQFAAGRFLFAGGHESCDLGTFFGFGDDAPGVRVYEQATEVFCGDSLYAIDNGPCRMSSFTLCGITELEAEVSQGEGTPNDWCAYAPAVPSYLGEPAYPQQLQVTSLGACYPAEVTVSVSVPAVSEVDNCKASGGFGVTGCTGYSTERGAEIYAGSEYEQVASAAAGDYVLAPGIDYWGIPGSCRSVGYQEVFFIGENEVRVGVTRGRTNRCGERYEVSPGYVDVVGVSVLGSVNGNTFAVNLSTPPNYGVQETYFPYNADLDTCFGQPQPCPPQDFSGTLLAEFSVRDPEQFVFWGVALTAGYSIAAGSTDALVPQLVSVSPNPIPGDGGTVVLQYAFVEQEPITETYQASLNYYPGEVFYVARYPRLRVGGGEERSQGQGGLTEHYTIVKQEMRNPPIDSSFGVSGGSSVQQPRSITIPAVLQNQTNLVGNFTFTRFGFLEDAVNLPGFCVSTQETWLAIRVPYGTGLVYFRLYAADNDTGQERTGTVTISWGDWEETWTVTQEA